jgi:hypothetical protein
VPRRDDTEAEGVQGIGVSGDTEIAKVPQQLPPERCPLFAKRFMPMLPTPTRDALESAPEAVAGIPGDPVRRLKEG